MVSSVSSQFNRVSGLASGLDTDSIVKQLTKADQMKIDQANQQKQLIEWKRDAYQEITGKLYEFSNKYFGASSNSLLINDSIKQFSAKGFSSPYMTVTTSAASLKSNVYIEDIVSLASTAKLQSSSPVTASPTLTVDTSRLSELSGRNLKIKLDGNEQTLTFSDAPYASADDVGAELQSMLNTAFGQNRVSVSVDGDAISLSSSGSILTLSDSGIEGEEASEIASFTDGISNFVDTSKKLSELSFNTYIGDVFDFSINGKSFSFTSDNTMSEIMTAVNASEAGVTMSYSKLTDTFSLVSNKTGSAQTVNVVNDNGAFVDAVFGAGIFTAGSDAVVNMSTNGSSDPSSLVTITRNTNSFELDGTTYNLLSKATGNTKEQISVNIDLDVDAVADKIKSFVNDYNTLLSSVTGKLSEKKYKDFLPLTDEQKKSMSESEVTAWTDKAKSGILNNDMYLKSIASDLRSGLFMDVKKTGTSDSIGMALASIGITTTVYSEQGQLHIDESKLKQALSEKPNDVINLFTQKSSISYSLYATDEQKRTRYNESGLLWRLSDTIKTNLSSTGKKGALISLVGSPANGYSTESEYSKKLSDMETTIQTLNAKLTANENRYWKQFTAMETALNKLNSQSQWLTSQMSAQQH